MQLYDVENSVIRNILVFILFFKGYRDDWSMSYIVMSHIIF